MDNDSDLLKIEQAKMALPEETRNAIDAVDWKAAILGMRQSKGFSFEQLGNLEIITELMLCGLLNPKSYPKELENKLGIPRSETDQLVNEMNNLVFKKIQGELIKNSEREKIFSKKQTLEEMKQDEKILGDAGIKIITPTNEIQKDTQVQENREDILNKIEKPDLIKQRPLNKIPSAAQKLENSFQIPTTKTQYTLNNPSTQNNQIPIKVNGAENKMSKNDPYRLSPDE